MNYCGRGVYQSVFLDDEGDEVVEWTKIVKFSLYRVTWWRRRVAIEIWVDPSTTFSGFATHEHQVEFAPTARAFWASLWFWQRWLVEVTAWVDWHSRSARKLRRVQAKAIAETPTKSLGDQTNDSIGTDLRETLREQREAGWLSA